MKVHRRMQPWTRCLLPPAIYTSISNADQGGLILMTPIIRGDLRQKQNRYTRWRLHWRIDRHSDQHMQLHS